MHIRDSSLRQPAPRAARIAALSLLADVRRARDRLDDDADEEALHDFRVALRRLRSWLRAFDDQLRDTLRRKHERALKVIARATGESRDLEVHIEEITKARHSRVKSHRVGADWMLRRLRDRAATSNRELRQVIDQRFDKTIQRVEESLRQYVADVDGNGGAFATIAGSRIGEQASRLSTALTRVRSSGDRAEIHEARIAAKRLRYLLEPFDETLDGVAPVVAELTRMQDVLGALHDAQLFASEIARCVADLRANAAAEQRSDDADVREQTDDARRDADPIPGLLAILRRLHRDEEKAFEVARDAWLGNRAAPILGQAAAVAASLERLGREGREIERKYLLSSVPPAMPAASVVSIDQGYLQGDRIIERVRRIQSDDDVRYYRTVKIGSGLDRMEIEEETTKGVFDTLWRLTRGRRIHKRRHTVAVDSLRWEIDEFLDRPLVLAEVELDRPDQIPAPPEWLAAVMIADVTEDEDYSNRRLAK
jgi:CHAD domain-containing protein/CYTH domain-containing protein